MKTTIGILEQLTAFSQNIELCREVIFTLRYADITAYTGLAESTMISYDTRSVSPYITVAQQIADLYCVSVERLCGYEINSDAEEILNMLVAFIRRIGGIPVRLYKEKILSDLHGKSPISRYEVYKSLMGIFRKMITDLHRFDKYVTIERSKRLLNQFTKNFHDLHTLIKINYRTLGKATGISIGNLTRLEQGKEPMLASVIKLADFFGVSITQLLSEEPRFDFAKIAEEISGKASIANVRPAIPYSVIQEQRKQKAQLLDEVRAEQIITEWLNKVDA